MGDEIVQLKPGDGSITMQTTLVDSEAYCKDDVWTTDVKLFIRQDAIELILMDSGNELAVRLEMFDGKLQLLVWGEKSATEIEDPQIKHIFANSAEDWQRLLQAIKDRR